MQSQQLQCSSKCSFHELVDGRESAKQICRPSKVTLKPSDRYGTRKGRKFAEEMAESCMRRSNLLCLLRNSLFKSLQCGFREQQFTRGIHSKTLEAHRVKHDVLRTRIINARHGTHPRVNVSNVVNQSSDMLSNRTDNSRAERISASGTDVEHDVTAQAQKCWCLFWDDRKYICANTCWQVALVALQFNRVESDWRWCPPTCDVVVVTRRDVELHRHKFISRWLALALYFEHTRLREEVNNHRQCFHQC